MKEKSKIFAKVRLKCFGDNSKDEASSRISNSLEKSVSIKNIEEDLYKTLLNEVPCTSNEKGTMTDATLKKKSAILNEKQLLSSPPSYPSINNVLQSASKNKVDAKVPIVLLSKSPSEKNIKKMKQRTVSVESKKLNIFEFIASEFENSGESDTDIDKVQINKIKDNSISPTVIIQSPGKSDCNSSIDELNVSSSSQQLSPDFKGFTNTKVNIESKAKYSGEKICKKKVFGNIGKETFSVEKGVTSLDHSYSNDTPEKSKFIPSPSDSPLLSTEYPRYVNRSVFGSPTSSKNPPDIMLHNDKINILRQMSQIFNDEKKQDSSNSIQNNCKTNSVNSKLTLPTAAGIPSMSIASTTASITTTAVSIVSTTASITTTTATTCLTIAKESYSRSLPLSSSLDNISEKVSVNTNSSIDKVIDEAQDGNKGKLAVNEEKCSPVSNPDRPLESSPCDATSNSAVSKCNGLVKDKSEKEEPAAVHLVSSYAFEREESIKVKSYSGSKGEEIDIIDGFTFFSFNTESEMVNYSPSKSRRKLKKKVSVKSDNKHSSKTAESEVAIDSLDMKKSKMLDNSADIISTVKNDPFKGFQSKKDELKSNFGNDKQLEKVIESSAFSSNDLDQYLTEHAELKISFPIPKCRAAEKGVTKLNEDEKLVQSHEILFDSNQRNLEKSSDNNQENHEKLTDEKLFSNANYEETILQNDNGKSTHTKQDFTDLDISKSEGNSSILPATVYKVPLLKGNDLVVKRGGNLLPLSKVFQKCNSNNTKETDSKSEIIYVPHRGKMLTLCGSLTKVNPSDSGSIKAKVALPRGHRRLFKHAFRVASRKVKAVEINEDLAEFALSALKTPTKDDKHGTVEPSSRDGDIKESTVVKPSKENILDILTAKFSIGKDTKLENNINSKIANFENSEDLKVTNMKNKDLKAQNSSLCLEPNTLGLLNNAHNSENEAKEIDVKKSDVSSKIKWNQNDILKKKNSGYSMEESKGFKKNINRFPSLSREMKRLNMNFVTCDKESDEETDCASETEIYDPCKEEFCKMGCICDSLKCRQKPREHCGKVECMFGCSCSIESWKDGKTTKVPLCVVSILNADCDREKLALKEKDFKRTVVQSGSELFLLGGEKKKRDIRIPQRFKDTNFWKSPSPSLSFSESFDGDRSNKENVPILPNAYKEHIKDFKLSIPWYDVNGVSIWCMFHSCYDCSCLSDRSFYCETEDLSGLSSDYDDAAVVDKPEQVLSRSNFLPQSFTENRIVCLHLKLNSSVSSQSDFRCKGLWTFKHWIHNAYLHSSRTCGYDIREKISKEMYDDLKEGYNLPLPKAPFIMGITLKNAIENGANKNINLNAGTVPYSKAVFYDGLGPGLSLNPSSPQACKLFAKYSGNSQLCSIYLKSIEEPSIATNSSFTKIRSSTNIEANMDTEKSVANSTVCQYNSKGKNVFNRNVCSTSTTNTATTTTSTASVTTTTTTATSVSSSIIQTEYIGPLDKDDHKSDKCFSLFEMIKEEEKRGELELDLSPKEEGKAILIAESRFRKLINMNIIGIIGLNKAGRCIINTVKSSEDLIKMQRLQQLISNNTIDIGPNMREIFASSAQVDQRVRYVMIRCDISGRWEIVGIVQRKNKDTACITSPKLKRHKIKPSNPTMLINQGKFGAQSLTSSEFSDNVENSSDTVDDRNDDENDSNNFHHNASSFSVEADIAEVEPSKISVENPSENLIIEEGESDCNLPCISSVVSGSDPCIGSLLESPPKSDSSKNDDLHKSKMFNIPGYGSYILNQPSSKVFGYNLTSTSAASSSSNFSQKNLFTGNLRLDSSTTKVGNLVLCPRLVSSTPVISSSTGSGSSFPKVVGTSVPNDSKIRMLLLPSTTPSGKSFLIPTVNSVPVSYSMIVQGQTNSSYTTSGNMTRAVFPYNTALSSTKKANNTPFSSNMRPSRVVPQVHTSTSKVSVIPVVNHKDVTHNSKSVVSKVSNFKQNSFNFVSSKETLSDSGKISFQTLVTNSLGSTALQNYTPPITSAVINTNTGNNKVNIQHPVSSDLSTSSISSVQSCFPRSDYNVNKATSQVKCVEDAIDVETTCEERRKDPLGSPDVKCISVKKYENCSAVDLSVRFKSIKLHWLSGTIRKSVLLHIFKMSKRSNGPISLSAKNDTTHHSSFLGMYSFCEDESGTVFPVLVLGTGYKSVLATSKLSFKELFRSNTLKYLINETSGELSSYTYDARGVNLIRIASKKKESGVQINKLGEKIPVDNLRDTLDGIDFSPNLRLAPKLISDSENEEIVLSDSDDGESNNKVLDPKNTEVSSASTNVKYSKQVSVSSDAKMKEIAFSSGAPLVDFHVPSPKPPLKALSSNNKDYAHISSKMKRKLDCSENALSTDSGMLSLLNKTDLCDSSKKLKGNICPEIEPRPQPSIIKPVLKIPNPYIRSKPDGFSVKQLIAVKESSQPTTEKTCIVKQDIKQSQDNCGKISAQSIQSLNISPSKVKQVFKLSPNKKTLVFDSLNCASKLPQNVSPKPIQRNIENGNSDINVIKTQHLSPREPKNLSLSGNLNCSKNKNIIDSKENALILQVGVSSNGCYSLKKDLKNSDKGKPTSETESVSGDSSPKLTSTEDSGGEGLPLLSKKNLTDTGKQYVIKRKLENKPCPLSKKVFRRNETPQKSQSSTDLNTTTTKSFTKFKSKSLSPSTPKKVSTSGARSLLLSPTSNQEFQQVFSGAPQFWLMDNTEKHNTLERIRRKGLAKMLENLYMKSVNVTSGTVRLPPKHIVLKKAENVIQELRAKDLELGRTEIILREKKTLLLNQLSDILKDCKEDVQRDLEQWISFNISNPSSKNKFEETWKPQNVIFEDEHIFSNSCGQLTVSGADITSYFATHTAGFSPAKSPLKYKAVKSQLSRRKFPFNLSTPKTHHQHFSALKNKLAHVLKTRSSLSYSSTANSLSLENPSERASLSYKSPPTEKDSDSRWLDIVTPPRRLSVPSVAATSDEDDDSRNSKESEKTTFDGSIKDDAEALFVSSRSSSPEPVVDTKSNISDEREKSSHLVTENL